MITKKDVNLWWLNGFTGKDPRGPSPSIFHTYDYSEQAWVLFLFS